MNRFLCDSLKNIVQRNPGITPSEFAFDHYYVSPQESPIPSEITAMDVDEGILTEVGNDDQPMEINDGSVKLVAVSL
jgi:hypothetical protein